jgi:hypothetical protein
MLEIHLLVEKLLGLFEGNTVDGHGHGHMCYHKTVFAYQIRKVNQK